MANELSGKRVAILVTDGFEQVELTEPMRALEDAGAKAHIVAPKERVRGMHHDDKADVFSADVRLADARVDDFDALLLPGGVRNPDHLRLIPEAIALVQDFARKSKPIAAICHGAWPLIDAGVVSGRTVTSWPSLRVDLENAGANWVDREVVVDRNLVTSRKPDDLAAFCREAVRVFGAASASQGERPGREAQIH